MLFQNPSGFVHQHLASSVGIDTKSYVGYLSFFFTSVVNLQKTIQKPIFLPINFPSPLPTLGLSSFGNPTKVPILLLYTTSQRFRYSEIQRPTISSAFNGLLRVLRSFALLCWILWVLSCKSPTKLGIGTRTRSRCSEYGWVVKKDGTTYRKGCKTSPMEKADAPTNMSALPCTHF
ncbi:hypothetical protein DVH24_012109 [Malus domestica]|uniref:BES1/BZR1 plant transcription factor N-terminal domain-containing protein n=1 Tax=Malus domestica TaxID=3750 RepID=A0A498HS18_MALDO|nr:hypothetical protein DVH24_012109 [Malus domestica]